jgi:hypothetical protein
MVALAALAFTVFLLATDSSRPNINPSRSSSARRQGTFDKEGGSENINKEEIGMMDLERKQSPRPIATLLQDGDKETDVGVDPPPIPHPKLLQGWNVFHHH